MQLDHDTAVKARITALRHSMAKHRLDACVILSSDPHLSEYLPEHWQVRHWLSNFHGSAGTLVVTSDFAGLWVDSRYWEQADADVADSGITVMYAGKPGVDSPSQWIAGHLAPGQVVWTDFAALPVQTWQDWQGAFTEGGLQLLGQPDNLFDQVWPDRPALPMAAVYEHQPPFACRSRSDNLAAVRRGMQAENAQWHVLSSLDDIAWAFNLRGSDVPYNPVFLAHAIIGTTTARLFVAPSKLDADLIARLAIDGVTVQDYTDIKSALQALPAGDTLLFDTARTTVALWQAFQHMPQSQALNPSQLFKACKNKAELDNVRCTMEYDGAALCEFFAWFEATLGSQAITELTVDEQITEARKRQPDFVSPSFGTIAGFNANGAMPHYQATTSDHAVIQGDGLLLIDSGGQYLGGTTDITRVVPVGTVSSEQRRDFTLVLKGMIALSQVHFPKGITGQALDAVARMPLWQNGYDYGHGTGHGVGYFLNVHEGPQSISPRVRVDPSLVLQAGMITSNEPGLYKPGRWGIRIENLVLTVATDTTEFGEFLKFETLTLCPIDTRCIEVAMLSPDEKRWLNSYHHEVRCRLGPRVSGRAHDWLLERTQPI